MHFCTRRKGIWLCLYSIFVLATIGNMIAIRKGSNFDQMSFAFCVVSFSMSLLFSITFTTGVLLGREIFMDYGEKEESLPVLRRVYGSRMMNMPSQAAEASI